MTQEIPSQNLPIYFQKYTVEIVDAEEKATGSVLYTTVGAIPSNKPEDRVWQLNLTGVLNPSVKEYAIVYDFKNVDYKDKDIRFERIVSGTLNICGQVLDASKVIGRNYTFSDEESTLTIFIKISKLGFRLKKQSLFSYNLNVDDNNCKILGEPCSTTGSCCPKLVCDGVCTSTTLPII